MRPSDQQAACLNLARAEGYVRASRTHAGRLGTSPQHLARTIASCKRAGWLRHDIGGKHVLTDVGRAFFASTMGEW